MWFLILLYIVGFFSIIFILKYTDNNPKQKSIKEDVVADVFVAVVKLTPDLHIADKSLKQRIQEYAKISLESIDSSVAASNRLDSFMLRVNRKEQIKVKELSEKVSSELKGFDFQYKKEVLIGMWSMAYADGQATIDQQKLISIVGKAMGLSISTCNKVETMFWQRMKAGKYGDYKEFEKRRDQWFEAEEIRKAEKEFEKKRRENSNSDYSKQQNTNTAYISPELRKAYAVLGLDPSASIDEIKNQKKKLLKRFHPDLFANQGDEMIRKATTKSQSINQAYEKIMESR